MRRTSILILALAFTSAMAAEPEWDALFRERRQWWSLQPMRRPALPTEPDAAWAGNPIDRLIHAQHRARGIEASPIADRATLLRRVTLALTGLPPTPAEIEAFLADRSPDAYECVVDRLLKSPRFGERWASHWMDVIRYAESHGSEGDPPLPHAWRFRDYLIRAFNADVPYDQLIREQIAGDLLRKPRRDEANGINESILGLGHLRMVEHGFQPVDSLDEMVKTVDNQIEVITKTFQALTVSCARCHDHKFDAISQRDYTALYGIFAASRPGQVTIDTPEMLHLHDAELTSLKRRIQERLADAWLRHADALPGRLLKPPADQAEAIRQQVRRLEERLNNLEQPARDRVRRGRGLPASGAVPAAMTAWRFDGDARDGIGTMHGELHGSATIRNGRLILPGPGAFARTAPLARTVKAKTLMAWVMLPTLDQGGGSALTLETDGGAVFDAIVFAERRQRQWMAGSDGFRRTRDLDAPKESTRPDEWVHMAISYHEDGTITIYRNGSLYGLSYKSAEEAVTFKAGESHVLFGMRHTGGGRPWLTAEIDEARLYDRALTSKEIEAIYRAGPGDVTEAELNLALTPAQRDERAALLRDLQLLREKARTTGDSDPWRRAMTDAASDTGHPLHAWVALRHRRGADMAERWLKMAVERRHEVEERQRFNRAHFRSLWNLTGDDYGAWSRHGAGLPERPSAPGEFFIDWDGERIINGIYPAGVYTHRLSAKQNGILTSPRFRLPSGGLSVRLLGDLGGGVRVIVDNYPLGANETYPQHRPARDAMAWVRLDTAYRKGSEGYIEFATYDDLTRPQRAAGGGRPVRDDGRSYFGAVQIVAGDGKEVPREEVVPVVAILDGRTPSTPEELALRHAEALRIAVTAWRDGGMTEIQATLLDSFIRRGLMPNSLATLPEVAPFVAEYRRIEAKVPVPRRAPGVLESTGIDAPLFNRGNHLQPGAVIPRGYLAALGGPVFRGSDTGRLQLAETIARPDNPLTARVMVNRLWHWLFGRGIVATTDNFGHLGQTPTHPELLDNLASRFVDEGWSIKRMIRLMVTSRTFQLSSEATESAARLDPSNQWLARAPVRRLEAEAIRDSLLAITGELNPAMGGPGVRSAPLDDGRRSVYLAQPRNAPHPFLEVFDKPPPATTRGQRDVTNLPAQALAMMNSPFVAELARRWGAKLAADGTTSIDERLRRMLFIATSHVPSADEVRRARDHLASVAADYQVPPDRLGSDPRPWQDVAHGVLALQAVRYVR